MARITNIAVRQERGPLGPFIGVTVRVDPGDIDGSDDWTAAQQLIVPLDLDAADKVVSVFVAQLGQLRELDGGAAARAKQEAAESAAGVKPGDSVTILEGAAAGRTGTVVEVHAQKVTVWEVQGLIKREKLQLFPKQIRKNWGSVVTLLEGMTDDDA